jgi:hypothetical protein
MHGLTDTVVDVAVRRCVVPDEPVTHASQIADVVTHLEADVMEPAGTVLPRAPRPLTRARS